MPPRAMRPCAVPGCRELVQTGRCKRHLEQYLARQAEQRAAYDKVRPERPIDYTSGKWRGLRAVYLREHPVCRCGQAATEVHHLVPVRLDPSLAYEWKNLEALCKTCHSRHTATRDGGYGRTRR